MFEIVAFLAAAGHAESHISSAISVALPYSPLRVVLLIAWIYVCVYLVQFVQFSPLVSRRFKPVAYIGMLLIGPLLLTLLILIDAVRKSYRGTGGVFDTFRQYFRSVRVAASPPRNNLRLFDSSGRSIDEIYGHGRRRRKVLRVLNVTEQIIAEALERRATDILIDGKDDAMYTVRLRIDGVLQTTRELPVETCKAVLNSIKAVSNMDISEKRRPQDGAFLAKKGQTTASFRVASAGALMGEKLSIRVLNQGAGTIQLRDVGVTKKQYDIVQDTIRQPSGMILLCGPTGSGKTTTLYAMLNEIDRTTRNVITVEDPIEAMLPNASQIEVNPKAGITFAGVLRSMLRQDPDVICVGEIRDEETAEIGLRAAQTGHLVLATLHCESNAASVIRLLDLGVSPILMASGLSMLMSQRLLRKLCRKCRKRATLSTTLQEEFRKKRIDCSHVYRAVGCEHCAGTGYYGRTAICDPMVITGQIRSDIAENQLYTSELRSKGSKQGKVNLRKEGLKKVAAGITSLEELKRVVG